MLESSIVLKESEDIKTELFELLFPVFEEERRFDHYYLCKVRTQTDSGFRIHGYIALATKKKKLKEMTENDMNDLVAVGDIISKKKDGTKDYFKPNLELEFNLENIVEFQECKVEWTAENVDFHTPEVTL